MINSRRKISGPCRSYQTTAERIARGRLIFVWNLPWHTQLLSREIYTVIAVTLVYIMKHLTFRILKSIDFSMEKKNFFTCNE